MPTQHYKTSSWIEFVKKHMTGKKFSSRKQVNDYMRELSKEWKKGK